MVVNSYAAAGPKVARMDGFLALAKPDHFRDGRVRTSEAETALAALEAGIRARANTVHFPDYWTNLRNSCPRGGNGSPPGPLQAVKTPRAPGGPTLAVHSYAERR